MKSITNLFAVCLLLIVLSSCKKEDKVDENVEPTPPQTNNTIKYTMPEESLPHEGTWLQWPHHYQYGATYRDRLDQTWVDMTAALVTSERVHIVCYDATEQTRITTLLNTASVSLTNIEFKIYQTDDVWVQKPMKLTTLNRSKLTT